MTDLEAVAFHEAGHAWASLARGRPVRYITLRPTTPGAVGMTHFAHRATMWETDDDFLLAAGPIAEVEHLGRSGQLDCLSWEDALFECLYLDGGQDDVAAMSSRALLVTGPGRDALVAAMRTAWSPICELAAALQDRLTIRGPEISQIFGSASAQADPSLRR